jgi:DUF4097 and DUF4098 domain-containing protein YvlB
MRRSSLVAPLILIGIGVLFLARNLYPDLPVLDFLAQYWPFILIAWGALRAIEILFWARTGKPIPANGIAGGEWVLVVFLCLIGSGLYAARHSSWFPPGRIRIGGLEVFGEAFDYNLNAQKKAVGKVSRVTIESFRGNARVTGSDTGDVTVTGRKTIRALQQNEANKADQDTPLEIVVNGDQIVIRTNQDRVSTQASRVSEDLEITIPKNVALEANGRYGDFDVTGLGGNVDITSDNAGVRLENIGGNVRIDTRRSDIVRAVNVKGTAELKGGGTDIELENVEGQVTVTGTYGGTTQFRNIPKRVRFESRNTDFTAEGVPGTLRVSLTDLSGANLVGPVRLQARTKDVQISDFTQSLDLAVERGDIEIRPGKAGAVKMDVRTRSGNIDLALPDNAKVQMSATTDRGEITNDFNSAWDAKSEGHGASLKGSTASDGPRVTLATSRGSVTVRKASTPEVSHAMPPLPAPPAPKVPPQPPLKPMEQ